MRRLGYDTITRVFNVLVSGVALILLLPVFAVVIVLLALTGEREVFYRQERVGRNQKTFGVYKFVTMLKDSPNMAGGTLTKPDDPRVLPLGRTLRKLKINELPQLFNVLMGNMRLVGPRPQTDENFALYSPEMRDKIAQVSPGVTGVAQVVFRNEEGLLRAGGGDPKRFYADVIMPYKGQLEMWYVDNRNLGLDMALIFETALMVLLPNRRAPAGLLQRLPKPPRELAAGLRADDTASP